MKTVFWRTYNDGGQSTHIEGPGNDYTLCGLDIAGDDVIHDKPPEMLEGRNHRITCKQCLEAVKVVKVYLSGK